jgi:hexulose-6-phosphate isomerase
MSKAIRLARDLGIRTIQLAGYDVYYEAHDEGRNSALPTGWRGPWSRPPPHR